MSWSIPPVINGGRYRDQNIEREADSFPENMPHTDRQSTVRQGIRPRGLGAIRQRAEISYPTTSQSLRDPSKTASQWASVNITASCLQHGLPGIHSLQMDIFDAGGHGVPLRQVQIKHCFAVCRVRLANESRGFASLPDAKG
jgi:hypothetical protein